MSIYSNLPRVLPIVAIAACSAACDYFDGQVGPFTNESCEYGATGCAKDAAAESSGAEVVFARDIRPILSRAADDPGGPGCAGCHYSTASSPLGIELAGLDLTTLGTLRRGGNTSKGTIVVPGKPEESAIVQKLRGTYFYGSRMPRSGPPYLRDDEIQRISDWIAQGAKGGDTE